MSFRQPCKAIFRHLTWCTNVHRQNLARPSVHVVQQQHMSGGIVDPPDVTPPIPEYIDRGIDEPIDKKKARLVYQSRKRGMTENGLLLSTFASLYLEKLTEPQLKMYDSLINKPSNDWEIYYWMIGHKPTPPEYDNEVMDMLKNHAKNEDRNVRLQQPALNYD